MEVDVDEASTAPAAAPAAAAGHTILDPLAEISPPVPLKYDGAMAHGVWLLKCPRELAQRWRAAQPGANLGRVLVSRPTTQPVVRLEVPSLVDEHLPDAPPSLLTLQFLPPPRPTYVLAHEKLEAPMESAADAHASGGGRVGETVLSEVRLDARIDRVCCAVPAVVDRRRLHEKETKQAEIKREAIVVRQDAAPPVDLFMAHNLSRAAAREAGLPVPGTTSRSRVAAPTRASSSVAASGLLSTSKPRLSEDDINEKVFEMFSRQDRWKLADLKQAIGIPMDPLKKALVRLCFQHRTGAHATLFELKSEYKHHGGSGGSGGAGGGDDDVDLL